MMSYFWIALTIIAWASWPIFSKLALGSMPSFAFQLVSSLVTLPLIIFYYNSVPKDFKWNFSGIIYTVIASFLAVLGTVSYLNAVSTKDVGFVTSLTSAYPALTFVLAILFLGESFTINRIIGLVLILFGAFIIGK